MKTTKNTMSGRIPERLLVVAAMALATALAACGGGGGGGEAARRAPASKPTVHVVITGHQGTNEHDVRSPVGRALTRAVGASFQEAAGGGRVEIDDGDQRILVEDLGQDHGKVMARLGADPAPAGVIGVISVSFGSWDENTEQLALARERGAALVAVVVDTRIVEDQELIDLVATLEVPDRVKAAGYAIEGVPVIRVDVGQALEGDAAAVAAIDELLVALRSRV